MAEEHNYKIVGTGKTTRSADKDLRNKRDDLVRKLKKGGAPTGLETTRIEFKGLYLQRPKTNVEGPSSFSMESEKDWNDVKTRAANIANLRKYAVGYTVDEYLQLTQNQLVATKRTQPPAGPGYKQESSLDKLTVW